MPFRLLLLFVLLISVPLAHALKPEATAQATRAQPLTPLPLGTWAHGATGDYLLRSDSVHAVIGGFPSDADADTVAPFRLGALLDLVPSLRHRDGFGYLLPTLLSEEETPDLLPAALGISSGSNGVVTLSVRREVGSEGGAFLSAYTLEEGTPGVLIESHIEGSLPSGSVLEDRIVWGDYQVFVPGVGLGLPEGVTVRGAQFLIGERAFQTLLLIPETGTLSVKREGALTIVRYEGASDPQTTRRWLLVGEDAASLLGWFAGRSPTSPFARVSGVARERSVSAESAWTRPASFASMLLAIPDGGGNARPFLRFRANGTGNFEVPVPAGTSYLIPQQKPARDEPATILLDIAAGQSLDDLQLLLSALPTATISVVDEATQQPLPCRMVLSPTNGGPPLSLGREGTTRFGGTILSASGHETISLPAGTYELQVTSGIEYHPKNTTLILRDDESTTIDLALSRAFSTDGWLAGDLGSRTSADPFSPTTLTARGASALAEGLDWIAPSNPAPVRGNSILPILNTYIALATGLEATRFLRFADASGSKENSEAIWIPKPSDWQQVVARLSAGEVVDSFVDKRAQAYVAWDASHPESFGTRFQALQILRQAGAPLLPLGFSNSLGTVGEELGYPRVYVQADTVDEIAERLFQGRYQVTNGPFLDLRINGEPVRGTVETTDGILDLDFIIHAIDGVSVAQLVVLVDGSVARQLFFNEALRESGSGVAVPIPSDPTSGKLRIQVAGDCVIDLVVEGDEDRPNPLVSPRGSPFAQTNSQRGLLSRAFHAPIRVRFTGFGETTP